MNGTGLRRPEEKKGKAGLDNRVPLFWLGRPVWSENLGFGVTNKKTENKKRVYTMFFVIFYKLKPLPPK